MTTPRPPESLVPVIWDGTDFNAGWVDQRFVTVVETVEGWYGTPEFNGHDVDRALTDGQAWGPKTLGPRVVTITGAAVGPRDQLMDLRDQLAVRAASRIPAELTVPDPDLGPLTADVRADTDHFTHEWVAGRKAFRWQVTLTAADQRLYGPWRQLVLTTAGDTPTGRSYNRTYPWSYGASVLANQATLDNPGSAPAPVFALFSGRLQNATLADQRGGVIRVIEVLAGVQFLVNTETLAATAEGGATRASMILPGSVPMTLPPRSEPVWSLYGTQAGSVTLTWRPAWE